MLRRVAVLLALAAALPAAAHRYHLERDFDVVRNSVTGVPLQNVYWVSLPLVPHVEDVADSGSLSGDPCVGDPDGPAAPDGRIDVDDLLCAWWTARANPATAGWFLIGMVDEPNCSTIWRIGTIALGRVRLSGQIFPIDPQRGLMVRSGVVQGARYSPRNHAVIEGDDDPTWPGLPIVAAPTCTGGQTWDCCGRNEPRTALISCPYDTLYRTSDEVLCGLEGVDWSDANGDGRPDRCWDDVDADGVFDPEDSPTGIFDGRVAMTVARTVNDEAVNGAIARTATIQVGRLRYTGTEFQLVPGEAYLLNVLRTHSRTTWLPPR